MPTPADAHLRKLLTQTEWDLAEAEQRRERQACVVSNFLTDTEARTYAETGLREIDRTIALIRVNREMAQYFSA